MEACGAATHGRGAHRGVGKRESAVWVVCFGEGGEEPDPSTHMGECVVQDVRVGNGCAMDASVREDSRERAGMRQNGRWGNVVTKYSRARVAVP